ncbi:unnamed protein product, partial [Chrysoparadoxa australica]
MDETEETGHYEVLGVPRHATHKEIKTRYRQLAKLHHPDKNLDNHKDAEHRFKRIGEAYHVLGDRERREAYDEECRRAGSRVHSGHHRHHPHHHHSRGFHHARHSSHSRDEEEFPARHRADGVFGGRDHHRRGPFEDDFFGGSIFGGLRQGQRGRDPFAGFFGGGDPFEAFDSFFRGERQAMSSMFGDTSRAPFGSGWHGQSQSLHQSFSSNGSGQGFQNRSVETVSTTDRSGRTVTKTTTEVTHPDGRKERHCDT